MPARSQAQQRFMGMVHAEKEGKLDKSKLDPEFAAKIERIAASIKAKAVRDYAETKHKGLPKKVKKKGIKKEANKYLKMLKHVHKGMQKSIKPITATTSQSIKPATKEVVEGAFRVKPLGSGHYNAFLGNKSIGGMSVNPVSKVVDDVLISKPFRRKGYGTKLYENVLRNEGGLIMNSNTTSKGAQAVWKNLSRKYPSVDGGKGVKWVERNIIKEGQVSNELSEKDTLVAPPLTIKDSDNRKFWKKEVTNKPTFTTTPKKVLKAAYNATDAEMDEIVSRARQNQKDYPNMQDYYKKGPGKGTSLSNADHDLTAPATFSKQKLHTSNLNKKVKVRIVPGSHLVSPKGALSDAHGAAYRGGDEVILGNKRYDHTFSKPGGRVTLPHEIRHTIQNPEYPRASDVRHMDWSVKPQEFQAGAGHIKQEYFRHTKGKTGTGVIVNSPDTARDALQWYEKEGLRDQHHSGMRKWLNKDKYRQALKLYMPFTVDNNSSKVKKSLVKGLKKGLKGKQEVKLASHAKDTALVGLTGAASIAIPFAPLHAVAAANRAPKGKKKRATASTTGWGLAGNLPGIAYLMAKGSKGSKKYHEAWKSKKISKAKYTKKVIKSMTTKGRLGKAVGILAVGQGIGAAYGYDKAVRPRKKRTKKK